MTPTTVQVASLFSVFGVVFVLVLSLVTLRAPAMPFYRSWIMTFVWALPISMSTLAIEFLGESGWTATLITLGSCNLSWWLLRVAVQLQGHERPSRTATAALLVPFTLALVLVSVGVPFKVALGPAALSLVFSQLWLGRVMLRVGKTDTYAGLGWVGIPVTSQGLWLLTYPVLVGTSWHWLGHLIDGAIELSMGVGMTVFVMRHQIRRLEETDRLKREFLNAASHELRTPLVSIMGFSEFLVDELEGPLSPGQAEYVTQIQRSGRRLGNIIDNMLDIARLEAGTFKLEPAPADLRAIVREEASSLLPQARETGIELAVELPDEPLIAKVDGECVGQVITNLVNNALKFTPAGGRVRVVAAANDDCVRVVVEDTGIGIEPERLPRVFEKFYQVDTGNKRAYGGAGLGLSICQALVRAHGGQIGAESEPGRGSTFWFTLPR